MPAMNYSKLLGKIRELGLTQKLVASRIHMTESHFSRKLSGEFAFKQSEIQQLCELLQIPGEQIGAYFFTPKN